MSSDQQNIDNNEPNQAAQGIFYGNVNIYNISAMFTYLQAENDRLKRENEDLQAALQTAKSEIDNEKGRFRAALIDVLSCARDLARDLNIASSRASNSALSHARENTRALARDLAQASALAHTLSFAHDCASELTSARYRASDLAREIEFSNDPMSIRNCARELFEMIQGVAETKLGAEHPAVVSFKQQVADYEARKKV